MAGHRWLGVAGLGLVLCMGGCHPSDPQPAPPKAAASKPPSAYPRCAKSKRDDNCVDLSDGLNPYEFEAKDYQAVTLPLLANYHKATAIGLAGARSYLDDIMIGHEHLAAKGYEHFWGLGRHSLGSQVYDYWGDPWGRVHEHWADSDRLNIKNGSNLLSAEEALVSQWGDPPPQKFIEHVSA